MTRSSAALVWPDDRSSRDHVRAQGVKVTRWGLRLLACLGSAFIAVMASSMQGHYNTLTALMLLLGLPGAAVCTVAGLRTLYLVPPDQRARGRSRH